MSELPIESQRQELAANRLEEYRVLQTEISAYLQQRMTILAAVVGAVGAVLLFKFEQGPEVAVLALYVILIAGALLTWNGLYQATRRAAYIQVFIESEVHGLHWYTMMRHEGLRRLEVGLPGFRLRVHLAFIPHEYPLVYLLLGLSSLAYCVYGNLEQRGNAPLYLALAGFVVLVVVLLALQFANTAYGFDALAARWERIRDETGKGVA